MTDFATFWIEMDKNNLTKKDVLIVLEYTDQAITNLGEMKFADLSRDEFADEVYGLIKRDRSSRRDDLTKRDVLIVLEYTDQASRFLIKDELLIDVDDLSRDEFADEVYGLIKRNRSSRLK